MNQDVANHQIRHLRGPLIEDTVNFQQRYHLTRLHRGRLELKRTRMWYKQEATYLLACDPAVSPLEIFTSALLRSLLSQSPLAFLPESLYLDAERIRALRGELCGFIQLNICCDLFDHLMGRKVIPQILQEQGKRAFRASVSDIVGPSRRFDESTGHIAVELVRAVLTLEGATTCYDSTLADFVDAQLKVDLKKSSVAFSIRAQNMMDETLPVLLKSIKQNLKLTTLDLHNAMLSTAHTNAPFRLGPTPPSDQDPAHQALKDIIRRITHLSVIHWHIWSPIVYTVQEEECRPISSTSDDMAPDPSDPIANQNAPVVTRVSASDPQAQTMEFLGQSSEPTEPSRLGGRPPQ